MFVIHFHHWVLITSSCSIDNIESLIKERDWKWIWFGKEESSTQSCILLKDNRLCFQGLKIWNWILEENNIRIRIEDIEMVIEEISNDRKLEERDEIEWRWSLIDEVKRLLILLLRKQGNRNLMMSEELWMNEKRNPHIIGQCIMNNNKEGWIVLKTVGSIEVESEFSISIGGNCDEDSIILLLQVHHLINIYSRMDIMEVKILIEWPFFISNRFLIEIDIEINKETKKENH